MIFYLQEEITLRYTVVGYLHIAIQTEAEHERIKTN